MNAQPIPYSQDAEKGVLSSILKSPASCLEILADMGVDEDSFHMPAYREVFTGIQALAGEGKLVDFITLASLLDARGVLGRIGGPGELTDIFAYLPTAASLRHYAEIVQEKATLRKIIVTCTEAIEAAHGADNAAAMLEQFEQAAMSIRRAEASAVPTMRETVMQTVTGIERLYENRGALDGLSVGIKGIDMLLDGLKPTNFYVIAARPGCGKTAMLMQWAETISINAKQPVAVFSAEMSRQQLVQRGLLGRARVNVAKLRNGFIGQHDFASIASAASEMAPAPLWIDDSSSPPLAQIRAKARRWRKEKGIVAVFVDYLQIVTNLTRQTASSKEREVTEISEGMKAMAKELEIPVVAAAQLNRKSEDREGGKPKMSDLRDSGGIEQAADVVGLLWREEMHVQGDKAKADAAGKAEFIVTKHRNGPIGPVPLTFLKEFTRFEDRAHENAQQ